MLNLIAVILCGICFRLDGKGVDDPCFLPFRPFNNMKGVSLNYARYAIGFIVFSVTLNPLHIASYALAASIPYGEKHWWMKYGLLSWFGIGIIWGMASLSWGVALWLGCLLVIVKKYRLDWSLTEFFVLGCGSTLWLLFVK